MKKTKNKTFTKKDYEREVFVSIYYPEESKRDEEYFKNLLKNRRK